MTREEHATPNSSPGGIVRKGAKRVYRYSIMTVAVLVGVNMLSTLCLAQSEVRLPLGVRAVRDMAKAYRETTRTRERICINGLWRWQPAEGAAQQVPGGKWGFFKVPGPWPRAAQGGTQTLYPHPDWRDENLGQVTTAWYQREIQIPQDWAGRRIAVYAEYLNSYATVYIDGQEMGQMRYPGGEVDITSACRPGSKHLLSLRTVAMPLSAVIMSYSQTNEGKLVRGRVSRRGLCGDVFLVSAPAGARIDDVKVETSVREWQITFNAAMQLEPRASYSLRARILDEGQETKTFASRSFRGADLEKGRFAFASAWKPPKLWDVHTPQNMYSVELSLLGSQGKVLDVFQPVRFGFREFWIKGRDFTLNETRFFCLVVPFENANRGPYEASYEGARETFLSFRKMGINTVFTHYYSCQPGGHSALGEVLRAADDVGMLISLSQPHFSNYDWDAPDAAETNGYARHAAFYVRMAQNHPSVVMYSTSHNATGYHEDMNPDQIGNATGERNFPWSINNAAGAMKAEAILRPLDRTRVIYHHSSGNLSQMYTSNFYLNFVPIQERSDWFERWSREGVLPAFLVEYGPPLPPTWTMYRGWYKGKRAYLSANVAWELCTAEWSSQFLGDRAFDLTDKEKENLRFETGQFRAGKTWQRYAYPNRFNSKDFDIPNRCDVQAMYIKDNWRAFRTWGLSGPSGWSYDRFWIIPPGFSREDEPLDVDWDGLQKPGYSLDLIPGRARLSDWVPNSAGDAFLRNSQPLLAYIGGKPARFSTKDQNFLAGETVEKQIIIVNNSRQTVTCDCSWSLALPETERGRETITVETGQLGRIPIRISLPANLAVGTYPLTMKMAPGSGEIQEDTFEIHVLPPRPAVRVRTKVAVFDPKGETAELLRALGVQSAAVKADADLKGYDVLVVGKGALTLDAPAPDITGVRDGLKVVMFEQTSDVLEKRFGFRVQEYGLRRLFARVPDHPLLGGLKNENLHDWQGEATIVPPRLEYEMWRQHGPSVVRSGIKVTRPWRCGCWGNVASVLIEKPACGDFLPIVDGGFSLQYSPLMVYREGKGVVVFCQMDVTGRSETDPAATRVAGNILNYVSDYTPAASRRLLYVGEPAGRQHLESAGMTVGDYAGQELSADQVLVVGPGGGQKLAARAGAVREWLDAGGHLLSLTLSGREAGAFLPAPVQTKKGEHICAQFEPAGSNSLLAGVGPADIHNRDPRQIELVSGGAEVVGNGVLAVGGSGKVVFCQLAPWQFDYGKYYNQKRTFRRTSFMVTRILSNMGVSGSTPVLERFSSPVAQGEQESRWLEGLYLEAPEEFDDPYRYFRW